MVAARVTLVALSAVALAAPVAVHAQSSAPDGDATGASFFKDAISADAKTTAVIKKGLASGALFIDPASQYGDLTGDGKPDAAVRVDTASSAGAIAVYVFTADANSSGELRIVYRSQQQHRVTTKIANGILTLSSPLWRKGDEPCCPSRLRELDYRWSAAKKTMLRTGAARTVRT